MPDRLKNVDEAKEIIIRKGALLMTDEEVESKKKNDSLQRERNNTQLDLKERNDVIEMRRTWSFWLLRAIIWIIVMDFAVIFLVGLNLMSFKNSYIVPFFIGESLIKTLGLALIVVKFLFNEKSIFSR